jgi:hypothetical protein
MILFYKHEKEYFKRKNPKTFVLPKTGTTFKVGGIGSNVETKETFNWNSRQDAFDRAEKYSVVTPLIKQKRERYQLVWH